MNKFKTLLVTGIILCVSFLFANIDIMYTPINNLNDEIVINIYDNEYNINSIKIHFKTELDNYFFVHEYITERTDLSYFVFDLKPVLDDYNEEEFVHFYYYFEITDTNNNRFTLPSLNPEFSPFQISKQIKSTKHISSNPFVIISPDNLNNIEPNQNIVISFFNDKDIIDTNTIRVILDNIDISHRVDIYDGIFVFFVPKSDNRRTLQINAKTIDGENISSPNWAFQNRTIVPQFMRSFDMFGNITLINNTNNFSFNDQNTENITNNDQTAIFNMSFLYKKIAIKNYLYISSLEDKNNQKLNKYYLGFLSQYFDLHLGDYSPNYSEFTVNNRSVYGVSTALKTNSFSFYATHGELLRKIDLNEKTQANFKRENTSAKIMFGNTTSSSFSLNIAKNKDILGSLDESIYYDADQDIHTIQAKDNIIVGTDFSISMLNRRLNFFGEAAMSMYNSNINTGVISKDSLENYIDSSIPFDPENFENLIVINKNIEPFQAGLNNSALKIGMRANFLRNNLNISFSQIGPAFYSLSSSGIIQDKRYIRASDHFIISNSLFLSAGIELSQDNTVDQKDFTISTQTIFFAFNYQPVNLPYFSFNFNQSANKDNQKFDDDTSVYNYKTDFQNQYMSFSTGYSTNKLNFAFTSVNVTYGMGIDKDNQEVKFFDNKKNDIGLNTILRFKEFPLTTRFGVNYSIRDELLDEKTLNFTSFYLNNEYSFFSNKLIPFINYRMNYNTGDQTNNNTQQVNLGTRYRPFRNTSMNFDLGYKVYSEDKEIVNKDYNYLFTKITLTQNF